MRRARPTIRYPRISVSGDPYERGVSYGAATTQQIARSVEAYASLFRGLTGWSWDRVVSEAQPYLAPIEESYPTAITEMRGLADGAGQRFDDILALNLRTEVMYRGYAAVGGTAPGECTALGVRPDRSHGGPLLAQNFDWMPHCAETLVILEVERSDGPNFVTVTEAGLLAKIGFNASGLGLLVNSVYTEHDVGRVALPYHVLVRAIYDCESLDAAIELVQRTDRASSLNFLMGHASGAIVDVEASSRSLRAIEVIEAKAGRMLHTNHFVGQHFADEDLSLAAIPDSPIRLRRLAERLNEVEGDITALSLLSTLSDHENYPTSICFHANPSADLHDSFETVASVVLDLTQARLTLVDGHPCSGLPRLLEYRDLFNQ